MIAGGAAFRAAWPVLVLLTAHHEVVMVTADSGRFDRGMAVLERLGLTGRRFVAAIVAIDSRARHIVNRGDEMRLADAAAIAPRNALATRTHRAR